MSDRKVYLTTGHDGSLKIGALCPTCSSTCYGHSGAVALTDDGRINLSRVKFFCKKCYPSKWEDGPDYGRWEVLNPNRVFF